MTTKRCDLCLHWAGRDSAGTLWEGGCNWRLGRGRIAHPVRHRLDDYPLGCDIDDAERCDVYEVKREPNQ